MEKRLIDANALMETIRTHDYPLRDYFNSTGRGMYTVGIQQAVDEQPTVDAVPVVRCSECKYLNIVNGKEVYAFCGNLPVLFFMFDVDTREFYCADGEVEKDD